jgi:hypothetical protein
LTSLASRDKNKLVESELERRLAATEAEIELSTALGSIDLWLLTAVVGLISVASVAFVV